MQMRMQFEERMKCKKCGEEKHEGDFYIRKDFKKEGQVYSSCKTCWNENRNKRSRLEGGWKSLMPDNCECCGVGGVKLFIEHQHKPFHFRGFVCESCNRNLFVAGDNYKSVMESDCDSIYKEFIKMAQRRMGLTL